MLTARVPSALIDAVNAEAQRRGMARSSAVREALALWLDADDEGARRAG